MPKFEAQDNKFKALPEADYTLVISAITMSVVGPGKKTSGAEMWHIVYDVAGENRKVFGNLIWTPQNTWKNQSWWQALGNEIKAGESYDVGQPEDHIGKTLRAHLTQREYNGDVQNDVEYFLSPAAGQIVPQSDSEEKGKFPF